MLLGSSGLKQLQAFDFHRLKQWVRKPRHRSWNQQRPGENGENGMLGWEGLMHGWWIGDDDDDDDDESDGPHLKLYSFDWQTKHSN